MVKEYLVSLNVSLTTPIGVEANNESEALKKAKKILKEKIDFFETTLDDMIDLEIEEDYIEEA